MYVPFFAFFTLPCYVSQVLIGDIKTNGLVSVLFVIANAAVIVLVTFITVKYAIVFI